MKKIYFLSIIVILLLIVNACANVSDYITGKTVSEEEAVSYIPLEEIPVEEEPITEERAVEEPITEEEAVEESVTEEEVVEEPITKEEVKEEKVESKEKETLPKIEVNETELVKLTLPEKDPDGQFITYTFTEPLNAQGEWQTEKGDAGEYIVTVTASDGELTTTQKILIIVNKLNKPPIMETVDDVTVNEGETISFDPKATDPEGEKVVITYSGWMSTSSYKTKFTDAGEHIVTITASDGVNKVSQDVKVIVNDVNRAPIIEELKDIKVTEGDKVSVEAVAADPDGDKVTITFSNPLNDRGEWQTKIGDGGKYSITVIASDGELTSEREFIIEVKSLNQPPLLKKIEDMSITLLKPGDSRTIKLSPEVTDPEGEEVTITYSGWMTTSSKTVKWGEEGGSHTVTVTASDGVNEVSQEVTITVNSAPCIIDCPE
jgi:hypothetical protein